MLPGRSEENSMGIEDLRPQSVTSGIEAVYMIFQILLHITHPNIAYDSGCIMHVLPAAVAYNCNPVYAGYMV